MWGRETGREGEGERENDSDKVVTECATEQLLDT